jgi:hypothetical protein
MVSSGLLLRVALVSTRATRRNNPEDTILHVATVWGKRNAYKLLVRKPEERRRLGRPTHTWVDNIKMDLGGLEWGGVDWIGLVQDRDKWRALVNAVMNLRVQ